MAIRMLRRLGRALRDRRGAVSPMMTLMLIPLIGVLALAAEASSWFVLQRSMQNAADSAAVAAAMNGCAATIPACVTAKGAYYDAEAKSVAAKFGYVNGANNTTVTATNTATCPDGTAKCYGVTITRNTPFYLAKVVGFAGNATADGGAAAQAIQAYAVASPKASTNTYCLLALAAGGTSVTGIRINGGSQADMTGCKIGTNGDATCNGNYSTNGADATDAGGTANGCSRDPANNHSGVAKINDPYSDLATNIPSTNGCSPVNNKTGYPQSPVAAANKLSGSLVLTSTPKEYCGNVALTGNVNVTTPAGGSVILIRNGSLDIPGGMTLKTLAGSGLTIIFTGPEGISGLNPTHTLTGGGTIDIAAPTSGTWSGVAIYTDPALTKGVDWSGAGNSPTWNITGLVYLPRASVTFSGIVNKASNGNDCFALVTDTFRANGTARILEHQAECASAGLIPPSGGASTRPALVK